MRSDIPPEVLHFRAIALASDAFALRQIGDEVKARENFRMAHVLELKAAAGAVGLNPSHAILLRSAAGCALNGGLLVEAEKAARQALDLPSPQGERHRAGCILAAATVPRWIRTVPAAAGETIEIAAEAAAVSLGLETAWVVEVYGDPLRCKVFDGFVSSLSALKGWGE